MKEATLPDEAIGTWDPLTVDQVVDLFHAAPFRWWISGGHALELHLDTSWRDHGDVDVGICRADVRWVPEVLPGWDLAVAARGRLTPWLGDPLKADWHQDNLWCRPQPERPWRLDIIMGSGDTRQWRYRHDDSIARSWDDTILRSKDGVPYLAPELQLLFKSKTIREKDQLDAEVVIPDLRAARRRTLASLLPAAHPWQELVASSARTETSMGLLQPG